MGAAGLQSASQAGALAGGGWTRLATAVERCGSVLGRDVVVDVGRLGEASGWPVIAACDVVVLVVRPTARSVQGAKAAAEILRARLGDLDAVRLLVNGAGPYPPAQVAEQLGVARVEVLPADPRAATALVDGSVATVRGLTRSRLVRAAGLVADRISGSSAVGGGGVMSDRVVAAGSGEPPPSGAPSGASGQRRWWVCARLTPSDGFAAAVTEVQQRVAARLSADGVRYAGLDRVGKRLRIQALVNQELESWVNHRAQLGLPTLSDTDEDTLVAAVHAALGGLGPLEPLLARTDIEDIFFTGTAPTMLRLADGRKVAGPRLAHTDVQLAQLLQSMAASPLDDAAGREFSISRPLLQLRMKSVGLLGARMSAAMDVTPHPAGTIRVHRHMETSLAAAAGLGDDRCGAVGVSDRDRAGRRQGDGLRRGRGR